MNKKLKLVSLITILITFLVFAKNVTITVEDDPDHPIGTVEGANYWVRTVANKKPDEWKVNDTVTMHQSDKKAVWVYKVGLFSAGWVKAYYSSGGSSGNSDLGGSGLSSGGLGGEIEIGDDDCGLFEVCDPFNPV